MQLLQLAQQREPLQGVATLVPRKVSHVKIRSFTEPGAQLLLEVTLLDADEHGARLKLAARSGDKVVATARVEVTPRSKP